MQLSSWELTNFTLDGQIELGAKLGLVKILRAEDGLLVLVADWDYGVIDPDKPTPIDFASPDSILGFVLDIGIRRERQLTYGSGFYFGNRRLAPQSSRGVSQKHFDGDLFQRIGELINAGYRSEDKRAQAQAIRLQLLMTQYNEARLLFPNFASESYLTMMRIIDALNPSWSADGFALSASTIRAGFARSVYEKLSAVSSFEMRLRVARELFDERMSQARKELKEGMSKFDEAEKAIFSCFYSAYQYRNVFVHRGFPFPASVKDAWGADADSGTAYLSGTLGISWTRTHRPEGVGPDDLVDIHHALDHSDAERFQKELFLLLPTWFFMKETAREAILAAVRREENDTTAPASPG